MAFLPNNQGILITEKGGTVRLVDGNGNLLPAPLSGPLPSVWNAGQGGLLDVAIAPDFDSSQYIYFTYAKLFDQQQGATTAVARAKLNFPSNGGDPFFTDLEDIFVADAFSPFSIHFGSRIVFDFNGMMFITIGERGLEEPAQLLDNHIGKTIRLFPDGSIPADNPFSNNNNNNNNTNIKALPEIYSYGHRNSQGMAVHPTTGAIWQNDHGPRGGDEINLIQPGANYGWPIARTAGHYDGRTIPGYDEVDVMEGVTPPLVAWSPAVAPCGMIFYTTTTTNNNNNVFHKWEGNVFQGGLVGRHLRRIIFNGTVAVEEEVLLKEYGERIRDVGEDPYSDDGYIYILTDDASNGVLARLEPNNNSSSTTKATSDGKRGVHAGVLFLALIGTFVLEFYF